MALKLWMLAMGLAVAGSLAVLISALGTHEDARHVWRAERDAFGTTAYDAQRSDRAYLRSRSAWATAGHAGMGLALSVLLLLGAMERQTPRLADPAGPGHRALATLIDAFTVAAIASLATIDDGESALAHALVRASPILAIGIFVLPFGLRGRTAGLRLSGLGGDPSWRGLAALLLLPVALLALPLGLLRPSWVGFHWRLVGVSVARIARIAPGG